MAGRSLPVAADKPQQSAQPLPIPRQREQFGPAGDDSATTSAQGSLESGRTASSSLSSYHTARAPPQVSMASRMPPGAGRNTSIDSIMSSASATSAAPSSLSNFSHSHQSSADTTIAQAQDAASFIEANGGSASAVDKLLKERQQQMARSEQLWRLLEKQRQMVHGMHADLEKALKDKERYRKRVKEVEEELERAIASPLRVSASSMSSRRAVNAGKPSHLKSDSVDTVSSLPVTSPHSPSSSSFTRSVRQPTDTLVSPGPLTGSAKVAHSPISAIHPHSPTGIAPLRKDSLPGSPLTNHSGKAKSTPASPGERYRKAVPAPLNLSQTSSPRHIETNTDSTSDSEEDIEPPEFDRGRRRTRAEDDKQREVLAIAEEMRSRSDKSKSTNSKSTSKTLAQSTEEAAQVALPMSPPPRPPPLDIVDMHEPVLGSAELPIGMIAGIGLPSSPRAALDRDVQLPIQDNSNSIDSVLGGTPAQSTSPQSVTLPPKSPGLPMSPRPMDRPMNSPAPRHPTQIASAGPLSPRGLPLSPRAPKHPVPMPHSAPNLMAALGSPQRAMTIPSAPDIVSMAERLQERQDASRLTPEDTHDPSSRDPILPNQIHKGFTSEEFPQYLLAPNALPLVKVKVQSSRLRPPKAAQYNTARSTDESEVLLLAVYARSNGLQLWRVEKSPLSLSTLDLQLKKAMNLSALLPDRQVFNGHAPAKLDLRRVAINAYFDAVFDSPMSEKSAHVVCAFFSQDVTEPDNSSTGPLSSGAGTPVSPRAYMRKEGFLAEKGKLFGSWKSRWFVLEDGCLRHYVSPNGDHMGNIRLELAQVAKSFKDVEDDDEYRHYFAILEPKRKESGTGTRHVLCAESDEERDQWVDAILAHISQAKLMTSPPGSPRTGHNKRSQSFTTGQPPSFGPRQQRTQDSMESNGPGGLLAVGYDDTVTAGAPMMGTPSIVNTMPSPLPDDAGSSSFPHSLISAPRDGHPIPNTALSNQWGHKSSSPSRKEKDTKKRSMFGFMRSSDESGASHRFGRGSSPRPSGTSERPPTGRPVFGLPLAEAAELASLYNGNICLPSPVYRCIQYLEYRSAVREEGIFRMSGSNAVINALKDRFDSEGDLDLRVGEYVDVHAVASLLKRYLRELPEPILTNELHPKFAQVSDIEDKQRRLLAINYLVHKLPESSRETLVAVFGFLIKVVNNVEQSKMPVKNLGIVFTPTLHIPTPLVSLFITEHDTCFTPSPLDPATASPLIDSLRDTAPPTTGGDALVASRTKLLAGMNGTVPKSAGLPPPPHDFATRMNGSFGESGSPRSLSETRRELRRANGSGDLRDVISKPMSALSSGAAAISSGAAAISSGAAVIASRSRSRGSPSPASRSYMTPAPMRATPPPLEDAVNSSGPSGPLHSSSSSSPSSHKVEPGRGPDNPGLDGGVPSSRRAKRESTIGPISGPFNTSTTRNLADVVPIEPRTKSSYSRLKDNMGMQSLREG